MKHFKLKSISVLLVLVFILASCSKNYDSIPVATTTPGPGLYVLSEGLFNNNNTTLTYYDYTTKAVTTDQFSAVNSRILGDTGNDVEVYGSKMYIIMNVSSTIEIVDVKTTKSIKQILMQDGSTKRKPRYVTFSGGRAYISSYDNTVAVLDTATLTINQFIKVGNNPEQLAVANGKLYVANSGGLSYPNYDNTVSVIDLATLTETKKITVVANPTKLAADQYGDVIVLSSGNYSTVAPAMTVIDSKTDLVKTQTAFNGGQMFISGDYAYITSGSAIKLFNVKTMTLEKANFITDGTVVTTAYGVTVDSTTGDVFVTDAKNYSSTGEMFCFDKNGVKKYSIKTGINPNHVAFLR